jgi:DNA-directed RNA polymerase
MAPTLKGINALQDVPFQINSWLLGVMDEVQARGIRVPGFTVADKLDVPEKLPEDQWAALSPEERKLASETRKSAEALNRQRNGDLTLLALDMEEAHRLDGETFYLPMSMDFRGRVYPLPRFHFQRGDHVRSLFLFKNGAPITEKGTYWLSVHVANCWAQKDDKGIGLDKKPLDERVQWVKENLNQIRASAEDPLANHSWWTRADAPFLFLAACRELTSALDVGSQYVAHLPVSFDGSCSGLQHLAGAMRARDEAELVNLTDKGEVFDIYSIVAEEARKIIEADAKGTDEKKRRHAELFLSYKGGQGIDRKLLKRNCMTFCYSSEASGMGDQQYEDLMVPLQAEAIRSKTPHHFGTLKEQSAAARYMGQVAYAAITSVVKKPADAMDFLKDLAKALAHEGKPVRWVTPAGLPCVNRYHDVKTKQAALWLHNKRIFVEVATGTDPEIKKGKCQRAISPNWVHSMDAAHLLLAVGACADEGITDVVTVHDSFGCLPAHADRFNQIIREQFLLMYQEHDVLSSVQETARADLTEANHRRLPPLPEKGTLDLSEVKRAKYAFA